MTVSTDTGKTGLGGGDPFSGTLTTPLTHAYEVDIIAEVTHGVGGTGQMSALHDVHVVNTVAVAGNSVTLPPAKGGELHFVYNATALRILIYPHGADIINGVGGTVWLNASRGTWFLAASDGHWRSGPNVAQTGSLTEPTLAVGPGHGFHRSSQSVIASGGPGIGGVQIAQWGPTQATYPGHIRLGNTGNYGFMYVPGTGIAPSAGVATLVGGTATVTCTAATVADSIIMLSRKGTGSVIGQLSWTVTDGVSFTINSTNALDDADVAWFIVKTF